MVNEQMDVGVSVVYVVFLCLRKQIFQELSRLYCHVETKKNEIINYTQSFHTIIA